MMLFEEDKSAKSQTNTHIIAVKLLTSQKQNEPQSIQFLIKQKVTKKKFSKAFTNQNLDEKIKWIFEDCRNLFFCFKSVFNNSKQDVSVSENGSLQLTINLTGMKKIIYIHTQQVISQGEQQDVRQLKQRMGKLENQVKLLKNNQVKQQDFEKLIKNIAENSINFDTMRAQILSLRQQLQYIKGNCLCNKNQKYEILLVGGNSNNQKQVIADIYDQKKQLPVQLLKKQQGKVSIMQSVGSQVHDQKIEMLDYMNIRPYLQNKYSNMCYSFQGQVVSRKKQHDKQFIAIVSRQAVPKKKNIYFQFQFPKQMQENIFRIGIVTEKYKSVHCVSQTEGSICLCNKNRDIIVNKKKLGLSNAFFDSQVNTVVSVLVEENQISWQFDDVFIAKAKLSAKYKNSNIYAFVQLYRKGDQVKFI